MRAVGLAVEHMPTEFEHNWMVEIGPRYRRLSDKERLENPLPAIIDPEGIQQFVERIQMQERRLGRWFRRSSQEPLPLKWERIYAQQLYQEGERVTLSYTRTVQFWIFRGWLRKWTRRLVFLLCLGIAAQSLGLNLEVILKLIKIPRLYFEIIDPRWAEAFQAIRLLFTNHIVVWLGILFVYLGSYFSRPLIRPNGGHRRFRRRIRYLSPDGIMMRSGQLVQWTGLEVVKDNPELFEIRLRHPKTYRVMLHIDCTLDQYIPIYLFVKKCLSKS